MLLTAKIAFEANHHVRDSSASSPAPPAGCSMRTAAPLIYFSLTAQPFLILFTKTSHNTISTAFDNVFRAPDGIRRACLSTDLASPSPHPCLRLSMATYVTLVSSGQRASVRFQGLSRAACADRPHVIRASRRALEVLDCNGPGSDPKRTWGA